MPPKIVKGKSKRKNLSLINKKMFFVVIISIRLKARIPDKKKNNGT